MNRQLMNRQLMNQEVRVVLPTLHPDQVRALKWVQQHRFVPLRCGRRWGKTKFGVTVSADDVIKGFPVGWFAPEHKFLIEPYTEMTRVLSEVLSRSSEGKGKITAITGGEVDFWSLENPLSGRGRKYYRVVMDEAAFAKPDMREQWLRNIRPTLVDYRGRALVMSNTNGRDPGNFFYEICNSESTTESEFKKFCEYHAPSSANPYMPADELRDLEANSHPDVWRQEYLAEFVDWSGVAFFSLQNLLFDGQPVDPPVVCEYVFATVDTAIKTGQENDGTAAAFWALDRHSLRPWKLTLLDWDYVQVEGGSLETWLPTVYQRLDGFAQSCRARMGSIGAFIEDKGSGTVLIQQAKNHDWPAHAIDVALTNKGKVERALSASGYHYTGKVKMARDAYERNQPFKGRYANHMVVQVTGFRPDSKEQVNDDCLDVYCYGLLIALGNYEGY
jgi:hypothetical protein